MNPEAKVEGEPPLKPLVWIASTRDNLRDFPEEVKDVIGFALYQAQQGGKHVAAKPLKRSRRTRNEQNQQKCQGPGK